MTNISKDIFNDLLERLQPENREIAVSLIDELIFIQNTLNGLKAQIEKEGAVINKVSGNGFTTTSEHPALKLYNTTIKSFSTICKTLLAYLPKVAENEEPDELMKFLHEQKENRKGFKSQEPKPKPATAE